MPKPFPTEFRRDVIAVARQGDQSIAAVARSFGVSESCLSRWLKIAELSSADGVRRWQQVIGPNGVEPARVTLHSDRRSGDVDAWLGRTNEGQVDARPEVHVTGTWRCA